MIDAFYVNWMFQKMTCPIITMGLSLFWKLQVYSFFVSSGLLAGTSLQII